LNSQKPAKAGFCISGQTPHLSSRRT
jgi:hypothetical protein